MSACFAWSDLPQEQGADELAKVAGLPTIESLHSNNPQPQPVAPSAKDMRVFFADSHCVFGEGWLPPLLHSLSKYDHKALAYPALDLLVPPR
mmetsp:Transcript_6549/g.9136  ORF Transcript_6549/g.9136 Transcript_6549/m.9136 type:complete len:92 (+) Transcript_6549:225-500(+)